MLTARASGDPGTSQRLILTEMEGQFGVPRKSRADIRKESSGGEPREWPSVTWSPLAIRAAHRTLWEAPFLGEGMENEVGGAHGPLPP